MMGMAFFHLMPIHVWRGDPERVIQLADEFVAMKENTDLWLMDEPIGLFKLWALASCGKICGAAKQMAKALEFWRTLNLRVWTPAYASMIAEILIAEARPEEAVRVTDENLELIAETGERQFESLLLGLRGNALLAIDPPGIADAEVYFRQALAVAREQEAKWWELRTANSLARLWRDQDKRKEAHDLLAPIYNWFTEGFDTADLKDAKALLDELA